MEETRQPPAESSGTSSDVQPLVASPQDPLVVNKSETPSESIVATSSNAPGESQVTTPSNSPSDSVAETSSKTASETKLETPSKTLSEPKEATQSKTPSESLVTSPPEVSKESIAVPPSKEPQESLVPTTETHEEIVKSSSEVPVGPTVEAPPEELLAEPPVAPPRRSPSRRKRLLGKRARKKTGGETGDGVKKPDPTTSEDEADSGRAVERAEERWKREDEEKRKAQEEKDEEIRRKELLEQKDIEQWTEIFKQAGVGRNGVADVSAPEKKTSALRQRSRRSEKKTKDDKKEKTDKKDKDDKKEKAEKKDKGKDEVTATGERRQVPWWKFWRRNPANVQEETNPPNQADVAKEVDVQDEIAVKNETHNERNQGKQDAKSDSQLVKVAVKENGKKSVKESKALKLFSKETRLQYADFKRSNRREWDNLVRLGNKCLGEILIIIMLCGAGAFAFRFTEGAFENFYKCGVKRVKRDFVEELWKSSTYLKEDEWKSKARRKLMELEQQLGAAYEASVTSYSGHRAWSFINSLVYSFTVITTIGYGHIAPATTTGKALTIVYAVIGIPMFLILLADFGKLFTRAIKWVWAFVRRLYYTGSCKKVRKTGPVQEVMKGVQLVYDMAAFRRASTGQPQGEEAPPTQETVPSTPAPSAFIIDEEFNLPISLAIFMLVLYIFCGAVVFWIWEEWSFFDSFYFVFISMSTIGFGDLVPQNKMYMMASIVYLAFGLALTSMCINVVQEKLSDTFRQASTKIGATIGLKVKGAGGEEMDLSPGSLTGAPVELALVHKVTTPTDV